MSNPELARQILARIGQCDEETKGLDPLRASYMLKLAEMRDDIKQLCQAEDTPSLISMLKSDIKEFVQTPTQKHDGKLDDYSEFDDEHAVADMTGYDDHPTISIIGGYGDIENRTVYLSIEQALSLRDYLNYVEKLLQRYEYRKFSDFIEGDILYINNKDRQITEIKRDRSYVALCWIDHGVPQDTTGHEDSIILAAKRPAKSEESR